MSVEPLKSETTPLTAAADVPIAVGIPIAGGTLQMVAPSIGEDATKLIDANTAKILNSVNSFKIKQRVQWLEAVTGGCIEQSNVYDIYDASTGALIMVGMERSEDWTRCCCAPHHSLFVDFKTVGGKGGIEDAQRMGRRGLAGLPTTMTLEREGCCSKPCLGCCICHDSCKTSSSLHAGALDAGAKAGTVGPTAPTCVGYTTQPTGGGIFTPTVQIMDRAKGVGEFAALAKVEGPCLFGGCSELCFESKWPISKMTPATANTTLKLGDMAVITKLRPKTWGQFAKEAFTDSDTYTMEFKEEAKLAPQQKATMIASLIVVDYMFFEQDKGMCDCSDGLKITFFECYCFGCVCPCNLHIRKSQE